MTLNEDSDNIEYRDLKKHGGFLDSLDISLMERILLYFLPLDVFTESILALLSLLQLLG